MGNRFQDEACLMIVVNRNKIVSALICGCFVITEKEKDRFTGVIKRPEIFERICGIRFPQDHPLILYKVESS